MTTRHFSCMLLLLFTLATMVAARPSRECVYTFYIKTGDMEKAGTDSKINLTLRDSSENPIKFPNLRNWGLMGTKHNYFEKGSLDIFGGRNSCINPPICKLRLSSDAKGTSPGWFVEYIEVTLARPHENCSRAVFKVNQWIGVHGPPYKLEVVLEECKRYLPA